VTGLDPTPTMVKVAIDRLAALGLGDHTDLREGTDESMPWADDHRISTECGKLRF
jgi:ubiquinone/menaquinone biosynthesis C-methylase UbiE